MNRATLLVINGANRGSRFDVTSAQDVIIGRSVGSNVRLDDSEVSRHHARINHDGSNFILRDLGSANGSRVNGQICTEQSLRNGDTLQFGASVLAFQLTESSHISAPATGQVRFVEDSRALDQSAIRQSLPPGATLPVPSTPPRS